MQILVPAKLELYIQIGILHMRAIWYIYPFQACICLYVIRIGSNQGAYFRNSMRLIPV